MSDLMTTINEEIDKRIEIIENPTYENVPKIGKTDVLFSTLISGAALVLLIYAYNVLC